MRIRALFFVVLLMLAAGPARADDPKVGTMVSRLKGTFAGVGAVTVGLQVHRVDADSGGWWAQILVWGPDGRVVWAGPKTTGYQDRMAFGGVIAGEAELTLIGDAEGTGQTEVWVHEMQSDISVPHYRVLRWDGHALTYVRSAGLVETVPGSGRFSWISDRDPHNRRWINAIRGVVGPGRLDVDTVTYPTVAHPVRTKVRVSGSGYTVLR